MFYGSIASFVAGLLLLMAFASPYWLVSWEDTQSPFKNMGLWEFCFYKFRHPDYQFDKLFTGCHALYGNEYRLIREKLLPGWLMVVQLFVTIALIFSFVGQMVQVTLLLHADRGWVFSRLVACWIQISRKRQKKYHLVDFFKNSKGCIYCSCLIF